MNCDVTVGCFTYMDVLCCTRSIHLFLVRAASAGIKASEAAARLDFSTLL